MKSFLVLFGHLFLTYTLLGQAPVMQVEGYLELYHSEDNTSTYIGRDVGKNVNNTNPNFNTFVGKGAGEESFTGTSNSFFGVNAGQLNTTGSFNSFFGRSSGQSNISGTYNSFYGRLAGLNNTYGRYNAFFGASAGESNRTGEFNSFIGGYSGESNTSGELNTFLGYKSGHSNITGSRNTFLGYYTGTTVVHGEGNVFIGWHAGPVNQDVSNKLYIHNHVSDAPLVYGDFETETLELNGFLRLGPRNYFAGGDDGVILGPSGVGGDLFLVANDAVVVEIGDIAAQNGTFEIKEGSTDEVILIVDEAGNLTIDGTLSQGSDRRNKEHIEPINNSDILQKLIDLPVSEWQYIGEDIRHVGPMAQDFYHTFGLGQGETTISSVDVDGVAIAAIKALAEENKALKQENTRIEQRIKRLELLILKQ